MKLNDYRILEALHSLESLLKRDLTDQESHRVIDYLQDDVASDDPQYLKELFQLNDADISTIG